MHGRGLIHSIGRNRPAPLHPWIERRIFPGAYPPSLGEMMQIFEPADLSVLDVENIRLHYARTLRHWLERYEAAADTVRAMFDETLYRMWRLYLAGSIAAFETGTHAVVPGVVHDGTEQRHPADPRVHVPALSASAMRSADVIIVGGGPAGSAAAQRLKTGGADVLVLDKESFPRHKLCAGWITPGVVADLGLDIGAYPHRFLSFRRLHWHLKRVHLPVPCVQHSIRRFEFDAWLLERSGAEVVRHAVKDVRADGADYVIDEAFRCRYLIGAGGTSCPVYRALFREALPRVRALQTVTLELEFPYEWRDPDCRLWFFEHGLPGYSWYVPKARGWLNVGIGGMAQRLKQRGEDIWLHWQRFADKLARQLRVRLPHEPDRLQLLRARTARCGAQRQRVSDRRRGGAGDARYVRGHRPGDPQRSARRRIDFERRKPTICAASPGRASAAGCSAAGWFGRSIATPSAAAKPRPEARREDAVDRPRRRHIATRQPFSGAQFCANRSI